MIEEPSFTKKKIIYITMDFINPIFSGNGTLSRIQVFGLADLGHNLFVICPEGSIEEDQKLRSYIDQGKITVQQKTLSSEKDLSILSDWKGFNKYSKDLSKQIASFKPNLILSPDWHGIDLAVKIKNQLNIPIISEFYRVFSFFEDYHDNHDDYEIIKEKELKILKESKKICVLCNIDKSWALDNGMEEKSIEITYPPVLDYFLTELRDAESQNKENQKENQKKNQKNNQNSKIFIKKSYSPFTVARVVREKKIHRLLPILRELRNEAKKQDFPFKYKFYGEKLDKKYWHFLQDEIIKENLSDIIEFEGKISIPGLIQVYLNSDCYIHTSEYEPFGITIIEAALTECPIFLDYKSLIGASEVLVKDRDSNGYYIDKLIKKSENGNEIMESDIINGAFPIDYDKPKISADRIIKILKNPNLIKLTVEKAKLLSSKLNKENYIKKLNEIISNCI